MRVRRVTMSDLVKGFRTFTTLLFASRCGKWCATVVLQIIHRTHHDNHNAPITGEFEATHQ